MFLDCAGVDIMHNVSVGLAALPPVCCCRCCVQSWSSAYFSVYQRFPFEEWEAGHRFVAVTGADAAGGEY